MRLSEAIVEMEKNLVRYEYEAMTETRFKTGKAMNPKQVARRRRSVIVLKARLDIARGWRERKRRSDDILYDAEQMVIEMYDLDIDEFTTPVNR
jgi:hypothetical protein